ncbi:MAG: imidazole glycerol phosphate synthase subunit HisH [Anaerolineales bacterium]|nr:MAG: imidazole glycerol phosphate synthase subunit HisH [Anaerolineales bacterium]
MLTIVDYGVGNLRSVYMAFRRLGLEAQITSEPKALRRASAIVLPGVGAFGDAIGSIRALGLEDAILSTINNGVPFLGICMGLQLLFEVSEEMGEHRGLGVLAGRVRRFPQGQRVPHMGWNQVHQVRAIRLWDGVPDHSYAYFVHSYYADPEDESVVAARTDYGLDYVSAVARGNVCAIQFHPEKSQDVGERILRNFALAAGLLEKQP